MKSAAVFRSLLQVAVVAAVLGPLRRASVQSTSMIAARPAPFFPRHKFNSVPGTAADGRTDGDSDNQVAAGGCGVVTKLDR